MSAYESFPEKQSVWFEPAPGAVKVRGYIISKNETLYSVEVIHVVDDGAPVHEILNHVPPSMLSKAPMHQYPSHIRSVRDVKVTMDLPAHATGRKRVRHEEPEDTDAEGPSSPVFRHPVPEWGPDDAMPGAEEQQASVENEKEEPGVAKEAGEVEEGEVRDSQIEVICDPFTQAVSHYDDSAKSGNESSTPVPSKGSVFAFGVQPLTPAATAAQAPSTGAGASVCSGTRQCAPGQEPETLPVEEPSQGASQGTLDISTHLPRP